MKTIKILIILLLISRIGFCEVPDWYSPRILIPTKSPFEIQGYEPERVEPEKLDAWMHSVEERLEKLEKNTVYDTDIHIGTDGTLRWGNGSSLQ